VLTVGGISSLHSHQDPKQDPKPSIVTAAAPRSQIPPEKPKTKAELRKEAIEQQQVDILLRKAFAKNFENKCLASGLNVDVRAYGPQYTYLETKYVLASKVLVYQFDNTPGLFDGMKQAGFKKFRLTDGYDSSWTWTF
jgi:hypothetical protein